MSMKDDWPLARIVQIRWFGELTDVAVIGYDEETQQVRVSHTPRGAYGSLYVKTDELLLLNEPSPTY